MERVVNDMFLIQREAALSSERGECDLVAVGGIYEALQVFALSKSSVHEQVAVVIPIIQAQDVQGGSPAQNTEDDQAIIYNTYNDLLKDNDAKPGHDEKRDNTKDLGKGGFIKEPANMKLP